MDVDVLSRDESVELLAERVAGIPSGVAADLAEWLGDLPLGLEQAAGYLAGTGVAAVDYLRLLRTRGEALIGHGEVHGHEHTIATLWDVSRKDLAQASPAGADLLRLCTFLGPEPVPLDLFSANASHLSGPLAETAGDEVAFNPVVGALLQRSLARRSTDGSCIIVHRLLSAAVRAALTPDQRDTTVATVRDLLYQHLPGEIMNAPENWPTWAMLFPHVLAATSHHAPHLGENDPTSWLLDCAGTYLQTHGQPAGARPLLQRALSITEATFGPTHPTVAISLSNLATVLKYLGDAAGARPLLERAMHIVETRLGPDHPNTRIVRGNLDGLDD